MNHVDLANAASDATALAALDAWLGGRSAEARVDWVLRHVPGRLVLSSSFGAQAAVALHMVSTRRPDIPVVLIDTGYLFPETYRFVDELVERLRLNLKVYQSPQSAAWTEARHGRLWEQGVTGIERYNALRKVEPMTRALAELQADGWIAGLRRDQAGSRQGIGYLERRQHRWKVHPLADWRDRDVGAYLAKHQLPYHPLWEQGYVSIGDTHTTRPLQPGMDPQDTRFFGLKRECGLHELP